MDSKEYFENYFKKQKKYDYSKSLLDFFEGIVRLKLNSDQQTKILDIGSGHFSLFEDIKNLNADVTAIDFSITAIAQSPKSTINYLVADICDAKFFSNNNAQNFNLLFDSHCLNCLLDEDLRGAAFSNIYQALAVDGLFVSELMVQPIGSKVAMPFKMIKTSIELEEEFISHGFKIIYFMLSKSGGFTNVTDGIEVNCDLLRVMATK